MNDKQVFSEDIPVGDGRFNITWAELRKGVDDFLREHNLPDDVEIEYIDFSWTGSCVTVSYSDGRLVVQ